MRIGTILTVLGFLALGGLCGVLYQRGHALAERLDRLETDARTFGAAETPASPTLDGVSAEQEIARLDGALIRLAERVNEVQATTADVASAAAGSSPVSELTPALDEAVRDVVLDMAGDVRFRTKLGLSGSPNLPKKPPFGQLADVLELDASQEDAFRKDLTELQQDVFSLLSEDRADGVVPLEEIARAEGLPESDPRRVEIFIKLFTLQIPGGDDTYMERLVEWTAAMKKRTRAYLRPEQTEIFGALDVDLLGVQMDG